MKKKQDSANAQIPAAQPVAGAAADVNKSEASPMIVAIGASAGGLESLRAFFRQLPGKTGMSFVVISHLSPTQPSQLVEILSKVSGMQVLEMSAGQLAAANRVYVLPSGVDADFKNGAFKLCKRRTTDGVHAPINQFFNSLALEQGSSAIGIVLSGTGHDGARGLSAIKEHGGRTFAECERTAAYFDMPRSAIELGVVDEVLSPSELAKRIAQFAVMTRTQPSAPCETGDQSGDLEEHDSASFQQIFRMLRVSFGVDFLFYKQSTLGRRISRRMAIGRIESIESYVEYLQRDPKELEELFNDLLISVTSFFRDPGAFQFLKRSVLPEIVAGKADGDSLRIWVPACATGEEVYSLAMVVREALAKLKVNLRVQIFGTDLSEAALTTARTGLYPDTIAAVVSEERLRRFFVKKDGGYQITREIRELCTFARQNICADPPFSRIDLLSCRNLLIYFGPSLKRKCVPLFHYSLNPRGFLILGSSETIGGFAGLFSLVDKKHKIYVKKVTATQPPSLAAESLPKLTVKTPAVVVKTKGVSRELDSNSAIQRAADQLILTHFAPCGVVIDQQMQVWHFRGQTGLYLEHAPGVASLNILKMVRAPLQADLSAAVQQCIRQGQGVRRSGLSYEHGGLVHHLSIEVIPFIVAPSAERWMLVIFEEADVVAPVELPKKGGGKRAQSAYLLEIARLRAELEATKESLQSIIEEQEATNEELKSANEEIESSNEELQSTNEELETAKEELQSTNEEITTVNDELNNRNIEISEINNDLNNLLSSINIAIVMVDDALTIRRVTPLAEKLFNIIPSDIGRRLSDINPNLNFPDLIPVIREVIDSLTPRECEAQDRDGRYYSLRVRPYRTQDKVIDGAVITLLDIHDIRLVNDAAKRKAEQGKKSV